MTVTYTTLHPAALAAIRAAANYRIWGADAARRYCRNHGVHPSLLRLARQLQACQIHGL